jgi:hypothetical protein
MPRTELARKRERFQNNGEGVTSGHLRAEVMASWVRCRERYGVNPMRKLNEVRPSSEDGSRLRLVADPVLRTLLPSITESQHLLLLADAKGQIVWLDGYRPLLRSAADRNIVVGSVWDETTAGTNGIGTAIEQGASLEVVQGEHFCEGWQDLTCSGALLLHPTTGSVAGVVDVTGYRTVPQSHTLAFVEAAARLIEREWSAQIIQRAWLIADAFNSQAKTCPYQPLLAFDTDGSLVRANVPGAGLLQLDPAWTEPHALPRRIPDRSAKIVSDVLNRLSAVDPVPNGIQLTIPSADGPIAAQVVPVVRDGQVLGGIALLESKVGRGQFDPDAQPVRGAPLGAMKPIERLVGTDRVGRMHLIGVENVIYAYADSRGVWLHTTDGETRSTYATLMALGSALSPDVFFQANRAELVNLAWVTEIEPAIQPGGYDLVLRNQQRTTIQVSRRRVPQLRELLHAAL